MCWQLDYWYKGDNTSVLFKLGPTISFLSVFYARPTGIKSVAGAGWSLEWSNFLSVIGKQKRPLSSELFSVGQNSSHFNNLTHLLELPMWEYFSIVCECLCCWYITQSNFTRAERISEDYVLIERDICKVQKHLAMEPGMLLPYLSSLCVLPNFLFPALTDLWADYPCAS